MKKLSIILFAFFVLSCSKDDPCDGIECFNGGVCVNGLCDCPPQFTGADCQTWKTPSKSTISNIAVKNYPPTRSDGTSWDSVGEHDPFIKILDSNNQEIWRSQIKNNIPFTTPLFFSSIWEFPSQTEIYQISLMEDDGLLGEEFICGFNFGASNLFGQYINPRILTSDDCEFEIEISFEY